jgi:ribonuclease D
MHHAPQPTPSQRSRAPRTRAGARARISRQLTRILSRSAPIRYNRHMRPPSSSAYPPPQLITTTDALADLCQCLRVETYVTVDTEFMRERTYWPDLCVVQLGGANETAVIDALAPDLDLAPLKALFEDTAITKVFHAARQDIEIFVLKFGDVPKPMFDTQVAAMVAGFGDQVGYEALVAGLTGGTIDKTHRFSDWGARPLSAAQIAYAAADVTHLRYVYDALCKRLADEGRLDWTKQEMSLLNDPATYRVDPETAYERLRPRSNNRRFLGQLQALAAWREREAQRVNIPRQRLVKDEALLEIAATAPTTAEALMRTRGITKGFAEGKTGQAILAVIETARVLPDDALPTPPAARDAPRPSAALVSLLKVLLAAKCEQHQVAAKLVANSEDIDRLAVEDRPNVPAMHGWRFDVFGKDAMALKRGEIALGVDGRRIKLIGVDA